MNNNVRREISRNKIFLCGALLIAGFTAACGGGSNVAPPPPTGGYSNSSLRGSYAFSMSGEDGNGNPIYRIGSFHADGAGNISAAIEDVNDTSSAAEQTFLFTPAPSSVYSVDANG